MAGVSPSRSTMRHHAGADVVVARMRCGAVWPPSRKRWSRSSRLRWQPRAIAASILLGRLRAALLLDAGVVVDGHAAERRDLLAPQAAVRRRAPRGSPTSSGCSASRRIRRKVGE